MYNSIAGKVKPFKLTYGTDGLEPTTALNVVNGALAGAEVNPTAAVPVPYIVDTGNSGFCLDYQEK